jgi:hypothetical protein
LVIPYAKQRLVSEMHRQGRVEEERYDDAGVFVRFRADRQTIDRVRAALAD